MDMLTEKGIMKTEVIFDAKKQERYLLRKWHKFVFVG